VSWDRRSFLGHKLSCRPQLAEMILPKSHLISLLERNKKRMHGGIDRRRSTKD
jgi:hypothetical protein